MTLTTAFITALLLIITYWLMNKKPILNKGVGFKFPVSNYRFTVYKAHKGSSKDITMILEGNRIDHLGYEIYKDYTGDLDKIDILIRRNETGEVWKIIKDGDEESMIGVNHPEKGHIGYLQFVTLNDRRLC